MGFFQLDDAEYAIPVVEELPSLESILTEPDCGSLSGTDDDIGAASIDKLGGSETASVGSLLSLNSLSKQRTTQTPASGAILRHVILKGICAQITSASVRRFYLQYQLTITILISKENVISSLGKNKCRFGECSGSWGKYVGYWN